jgi:PPK2 family polyphosphate:nucleotide phosphotransferase
MREGIGAAFRINPGERMQLSKRDPRDTVGLSDKKTAEERTKKDGGIINELQDRLFAERRRALLIVLQGIDTSGKDGTIRHVFNQTGPMGVVVTPFGRPNAEELAHDYLWRAHLACPKRGYIGIFNRSHYEDVLIVRVKRLAPADAIEARYAQINDFEKMLAENGTVILKFMLHISKKEQAERLQARLDERKSQWKFNPDDLQDRKLWNQYQKAYELMLERCSTKWAPWHVIPGDRKWVRNATIAAITRATLEDMNPQYPKPDWKPKDFKIV